jgi:hypothetical protein
MSADEANAMARLRIAAEFGLFRIDDPTLAKEIILRRPFWSQAANKFIYDDVKAVPLIEMAVAGDHAADALLREFAAELLPEGNRCGKTSKCARRSSPPAIFSTRF